MSFDAVLYEKVDHIAVVTLNRPSALNAINVQVRDDLFQILPAIEADEDVRVAIIRGAGRAFSAGADVSEFGTAPSPVEARRIRHLRPVWQMAAAMKKPVIASIHGYAIGAGVELAMLCDIRLAAEGTLFSVPEVTLGLIPGAGGSQTLPRAIRISRALELILTGRRIDTREALRIGLVNRVVPPQSLLGETMALAERIASRAPLAVQAAKQAISGGLDRTLAEGLALERRLRRTLRGSYDSIEGQRAFVEKREPVFLGR